MNAIDRKPWFWAAYALLAAASLVLAWRLFPLAIPILHLDITMTRSAALAKATALADERKLAPDAARTAIAFNHDLVTQNYVELEGGGKPAFAQLVAGHVYAPYWWDVRLFKPGVIDEVLIRFTPSGRLDGFTRRVAETYVHDAARQALSPDAALALARDVAARDWNIDFAPYRLIEQSQQTRLTGRVDHLFVFEHDQPLGQARIRLQLVVDGDELIQVRPFVFVPESFERRYQELRSANDAIAGVATITAGVLYGLVGCILGALILLRQRWLVWKPPLVAGLVIGALLAGTVLANSPAAWFGFSTAQEAGTFWWRQTGLALLAFLGGGLLLGEVFMAAEGLVRRAFPHQPQLWRLWSREAGGTVEVAGRTAGGYLFVPVELALISLFYFATNQWLGWWQPSESLTDPDILASYLPALTPIALSLQAGFMEECVFRAVPLALGALIGARYGHRRLGIAFAFVLQAVVFGAAHANYPGFPSYSRLVELVVPAMLWAAIFLRYGLLPTILLHALFDLSLFSIPLFLIDAPEAWVQRGLVIAAALVPVFVVLLRRAQAGAWGQLPAALWNRAWQPPAAAIVAPIPVVPAGTVSAGAAALQRWMPLVGIAGLAAWLTFTTLRADVPPLPESRDEAVAIAEAALAARGVTLGSQWKRLATTSRALDDPTLRTWHAYVWREAGPAAYRKLIGTTLAPPLWDVRFARFDGDVAERAEEWRVTVMGDGRVRQVVHHLPEGRPGATLEREAAQAIAERALRERLGLDPSALVLRSAEQTQQPARRDWTFSYADPHVVVGPPAEARVQVALAGDEVAGVRNGIFVPETWRRDEAKREGGRQLVKFASIVLVVMAGVVSLVYAVIAWSRGRSDRRALRWIAALALLMVLAGSANNAPTLAFALRTAEPVVNQLLLNVLSAVAGGLFLALTFGLLAGVGAYYARTRVPTPMAGRLPFWMVGVAAALATAGIAAALGALVAPPMPSWPALKNQAAAWPWAAALTSGLAVLPALTVTLFLLSVIDRATSGWARRLPLAALMLVLIGVAFAILSGQATADAILQGAVGGLTTFAFAWLLLRYDLRAVPAFVATGIILDGIKSASLAGTPMTWVALALAGTVLVVLALAATRYLSKPLSNGP